MLKLLILPPVISICRLLQTNANALKVNSFITVTALGRLIKVWMRDSFSHI